jgi:ketosteroid isomerase-like protein
MKRILVLAFALSASFIPGFAAAGPAAAAKAEIQALEDRFAAAFNAKDLDGIMKVYEPGPNLFVFDVAPPRDYVGWDAYRRDWQNFLGTFKGPIKVTVSDLDIFADGTMGYSHSIQHVTGTDTKGKAIEFAVRVTDVYRKIGGAWLIVHEHVSVPVNFDTGKPDMMSTP